MPKAKVEEQKKAKKLYELGYTVAEVASAVGVSKSTVSLWSRHWKRSPVVQDEIDRRVAENRARFAEDWAHGEDVEHRSRGGVRTQKRYGHRLHRVDDADRRKAGEQVGQRKAAAAAADLAASLAPVLVGLSDEAEFHLVDLAALTGRSYRRWYHAVKRGQLEAREGPLRVTAASCRAFIKEAGAVGAPGSA